MRSLARFLPLVLLAAVPVTALMSGRGAPDLPELLELPPFELVSQAGEPFGREQMRDRVWIADFIFTNCSSICPKLTARMRSVQDRLVELDPAGRVGLLSITVDPGSDSPARLADYARRAEARDGRWYFLTGDPKAVEAAVVRGFRVGMGTAPRGEGADPSDFEIVHGGHLVLVDRSGTIRGYYDSDAEGAERILDDALRLTAGGRW